MLGAVVHGGRRLGRIVAEAALAALSSHSRSSVIEYLLVKITCVTSVTTVTVTCNCNVS